ncbi:hypothetical protein DL96DRAFT_1013827 [Flagelloscypha sp. PMI_526]|nr:hypothetical protein DL96DRAFT_1013827 [Flagelloscypha sp. PMI_526]
MKSSPSPSVSPPRSDTSSCEPSEIDQLAYPPMASSSSHQPLLLTTPSPVTYHPQHINHPALDVLQTVDQATVPFVNAISNEINNYRKTCFQMVYNERIRAEHYQRMAHAEMKKRTVAEQNLYAMMANQSDRREHFPHDSLSLPPLRVKRERSPGRDEEVQKRRSKSLKIEQVLTTPL